MARLPASRVLRAWLAGLLVASASVGCQSVFGDFKIDDAAFNNASGGMAGNASTAGAGGESDGGMLVQTGIIVMPTSGLKTTEWGTQAKFTIKLDHQPTADVTVPLRSNDTTEGTVSPDHALFTKDNWNAPQVITVTGVDDSIPDPNTAYAIITGKAVSTDLSFSGLDPADVQLINIDNETAGVTVVPTSGLVTSESGMQDTFTVVLNSKPSADVSVSMKSSRPDEGSVSPTSLVFTSLNWMAPRLVTVIGVDDAKKDGPQPYEIDLTETSTDLAYSGNPIDAVHASNLDNETAGVSVVLVSGVDPNDDTKLRTGENGDSATFTVQLIAAPSADVTILVTSDNTKEGMVTPSSLVFTTANWMAPQAVTVTGVDDGKVADGDQPYNIVLGAPTGADSDYANLLPKKVMLTNIDNDHPGATVALITGIDKDAPSQLMTDEGGGTATFTVVLTSQPSASVTFTVSSGAPTEGTVSPASLTFTPDNWNGAQTVTVKGVNDQVQDGNQVFKIMLAPATSGDKGYDGLVPNAVTVTNRDDDTAGVVVSQISGTTSESGDSATFTIKLQSQPTADVTITLVSGNTKEGTVSPAQVKFTSANYGSAQTITVTGVNDPVPVADGNQPYVIAVGVPSSNDATYAKLTAQQVNVTNLDNDSAGVVVTPTTGLVTSEAGKTATFTVKLTSSPTADVNIGVSSSNTAEGTVNVTSLKFTQASWNAPQTVTITGVQDDGTADGAQGYTIVLAKATSTDAKYAAAAKPQNVSVTNNDDDTAGIICSPLTGLVTTESGGTATFTVTLQSRPKAPVKITLKSDSPAEGTISPTVLNFTSANYSSAQTVTVTGVNDLQPVQDGPQTYKIVANGGASSTDVSYNNLLAPDVTVVNNDNDSAGIFVSPAYTVANPGVTTEAGGISTFTVVLNSVPAGNVTFSVSSLLLSEGTVLPSTLSFTSANWNAPQTVTVKGVDDSIQDNDQPYKVRLSNATSSDVNYNGKFQTDVPFVNADNDHAGYVVNAAANLTTSESGTTATFTIMLLSQPAANVTVNLSSSNIKEGSVLPGAVTFTNANGSWNNPVTITVTGVDDNVADSAQMYTIGLASAVSTDPNYSGKFGTTVPLTNLDNDTPGFVLAGTTGLQTTESGGTATFTVALATQPTGTNTVTLPLSSSNTKEGTVSPSSLLFTVDNTSNWAVPQSVTITGVDDTKADGLQGYQILFGAAVSGDPGYANKSPLPVNVSNADNDHAGVTVTPTTCSTTPGTTAQFSVVLTSQPGDFVNITLTSDTPTEGVVSAPSPATLTFDPALWNVPQIVTVTGVDDGTMMSSMTSYNIVTGNASSPGDTTGYNGADVVDVTCSNTITMPPPTP
ncbi:MAG: Calx-beta domain-containing protein [Polyangiaceae bacterium]